MVEYEEFAPVAVEIIEAMLAKKAAEEYDAAQNVEALNTAEMLVHGMTQQEIETWLSDMFNSYDQNGDGHLDRGEFKAALIGADLGLKKKEINALLNAIDVDGDGKVTYQEFVPLAYDILVTIIANDFKENNMPEAEIAEFLTELFR